MKMRHETRKLSEVQRAEEKAWWLIPWLFAGMFFVVFYSSFEFLLEKQLF